MRIYTSVLAIQETNVLSFRAGRSGRDTTPEINSFARIVGVDRNIALLAAKLEAQLLDTSSAHPDEQMKTRRKWDSFHLATAMSLKCSVLYTPDNRFRKMANRVTLEGLKLLEPKPSAGTLLFPPAKIIEMPR